MILLIGMDMTVSLTYLDIFLWIGVCIIVSVAMPDSSDVFFFYHYYLLVVSNEMV